MQTRTFFRPFDVLVILLVIGSGAWAMLTFRFTEGSRAVVYIANKKFAWYPLAGETKRIAIPSQIGIVWLEIGSGTARVVSSPCPNKLCVKTGVVRHSHEEIVCLPAKLLLTLEGQDGPGPMKAGADAITY